MDSFGLIAYGNAKFFPIPDRCINWKPPSGLTRLSFRGLSGAFVLLGVGFALAFSIFIIERLIEWRKAWKRNVRLMTELNAMFAL